MKIGEFFFQLGVKADTYTVKDFAKTLADMPLYAAGAITALAGIEFGFMALTRHTLGTANSLTMFNAQTGLSTQELQRWQNVAKTVGVEAETVESSIMGINTAITRMLRFGEGGAGMALSRLGINAKDWYNKTPFEIMSQLRKRYQTSTNKAEFAQLLGQLGVSPDMMRLFQMGPGQFSAAFNRRPAIDQGGLQTMAEFQNALGQLNITLNSAVVPVIKDLMPYMKDIAELLSVIIIQGGGFITKTLGQDAQVLNEIRKMGVGNFLKGLFDYYVPENKSGKFEDSVVGKMLGFSQQPVPAAAAQGANASGPTTVEQNLSVTQHIHGVTDGADADSVGSKHLASELTRASKHFGRER